MRATMITGRSRKAPAMRSRIRTAPKAKAQKLYTTPEQPKLAKGESLGFLSTGVHLAPSVLSGFQTCASASAGCASLCLNFQGHGQFNKTQIARIKKTRELFTDRPEFMRRLVRETQAFIRKCARERMNPAIRLNLTSDIRWELIPVTVAGEWFPNIMAAFPDVAWYDYTKHKNRKRAGMVWPVNYHLTFSRSENVTLADCVEMIDNGTNVAIVFNIPLGEPLPETFMGRPVIDGRTHDLRFLDPIGVWVGLSYLNKAGKREDVTGFVVNV